jgi:hypothetical protein
MLALQREARGKPKPQPQLWLSSRQDQRGNIRAGRPAKGHEHVCVEVGTEILRRGNDTNAGEEHRITAAAHRARGEPREPRLRCCENHRREANRKERVAEAVARGPGGDSHAGRLIHLSPGEMMAAHDEVQLVAEESIVLVERNVQNQGKKGDPAEEHPIALALFNIRLALA